MMLLLLVATTACANTAAFAAAATPQFATRLDRLYEVADSREVSGNARIEAIVAAYEQLFHADVQRKQWSDVDDADLDVLFMAVRQVGAYSGDPGHARAMARVLEQLQARGIAGTSHIEVMHGLYVHARMMDEARALAAAHPAVALEQLPVIHPQMHEASGSKPPVWQVSGRERALSTESIDLQVPALIVVVSHPRCGFSRGAADAILEDATLGPVFARHARWIMPPATRLDFDVAQQWNRTHAETPVSMAIRRDDWPMIESWNTPTFYFFRDGELATTVTGWPLDDVGRRAEVLGALRTVGLLE